MARKGRARRFREARELKQGFDISHLDYGVLSQLSFRDDRRMRMADLADRFGVGRSHMTYRIARLERKGLLSSRLVPSTAGPARKYYRTTPAGVDELKRALTDWLALSTNVERVMSSTIDRPSPERSPLTTRR